MSRSQLFFTLEPLLFFLLMFLNRAQAQSSTRFAFNGFKGNESEILRYRASRIEPDGSLRLTDKSNNELGRAFYHKPIQMLTNPSSASPNVTVSSFSSSFVFVIYPSSSNDGGYGLTFTLSPSPDLPGAKPGHFLGLFNETSDGKSTNRIFAVEFDTVNGYKDKSDTTGNHVGINIYGLNSKYQRTAFYHDNNNADKEEDFPLSGEPIQAWIDYEGETKSISVTVCPTSKEFKPSKPLISEKLDLSPVVENSMYVGFSASTGNRSSSHYIMGWSFSMNGKKSDALNVPKLPLPQDMKPKKSVYDPRIIALITSLSIVTLILILLLLSFVIHKTWMMQDEVLEDWEMDYPHRFRYKDLYAATKGFKESEIIGHGGFGTVYKGVSPSNGSESIAVKKITPGSIQGVREFVAEIESLGRLRHKNLVNLQGWCKHKNSLLLVYDFIPNGSLDTLLYRKPEENGTVLGWDGRFRILKGVASGLQYLHEDWEQVVIHRDVKSGNVLIDAEMNARLGDFGLARLYDHGTMSHVTNVVGTVGYIAPELYPTGNVSTSSDVYAYGVLLLEAVSGRKPTGSGNFFLADWVMELYEKGVILEAVDPKLELSNAVDEVMLCLSVGLLCCRQNAALRPSMKQVLKYLNGDEQVPLVDNYWEAMSSSKAEFNSRFSQSTSSDSNTTPYQFSSFTGISSTSLDNGRY